MNALAESFGRRGVFVWKQAKSEIVEIDENIAQNQRLTFFDEDANFPRGGARKFNNTQAGAGNNPVEEKGLSSHVEFGAGFRMGQNVNLGKLLPEPKALPFVITTGQENGSRRAELSNKSGEGVGGKSDGIDQNEAAIAGQGDGG